MIYNEKESIILQRSKLLKQYNYLFKPPYTPDSDTPLEIKIRGVGIEIIPFIINQKMSVPQQNISVSLNDVDITGSYDPNNHNIILVENQRTGQLTIPAVDINIQLPDVFIGRIDFTERTSPNKINTLLAEVWDYHQSVPISTERQLIWQEFDKLFVYIINDVNDYGFILRILQEKE